MTTKELIPETNGPEEKVWLLDELILWLSQQRTIHGNIPVVGRGYEMGMDNLQPEVLHIFRGSEGCCGTYADSNWKDETKEGILAVALGNAG